VSNSINAPVSRGYTIGKSRLLHKNLLMLCYEKILLMSTLTYRGDYPATSPAVRNGVLRAFLVQEGLMLPVTSEANLVNSALRTFNIHAPASAGAGAIFRIRWLLPVERRRCRPAVVPG